MARRILFIDDLRDPIHPDETTLVRSAKEAEPHLLNPEAVWDEVWFDHDLGGDFLRPDTVMPLVNQLEQRCHEGAGPTIGKVFIHTSNPVGAQRIQAALSKFYPCEVVDYFAVLRAQREAEWAQDE